MTQNGSEQPTFLQLDLDQWRRDIQTFANTTRQALQAISSELFQSAGQATPDDPAPRQAAPAEASCTARPADSNANRSVRRPPVGTDPANSDEARLARMKKQIEQRLENSQKNSPSGLRN